MCGIFLCIFFITTSNPKFVQKNKRYTKGAVKVKLELEFNKDLLWYSDWNGYEVGHPNVYIVGLYALVGTDVSFFIDMENMRILEAFCECLDEQEGDLNDNW